jgi:ornithine cyclodeaminase
MAEAGDLIQAFATGAARVDDIQGDLFQMCQGQIAGRRHEDEITVFKSVGTALEDLAAAILVTKEPTAA